MKRILIIDESPAVRETIALILGREFTVIQRSPEKGVEFSDNAEEAELMIIGVAPVMGGVSSHLAHLAARAPVAILFLVDSKAALRQFQPAGNIGCLAKPFNPYELREKVGELLARRSIRPPARRSQAEKPNPDLTRFIEYPFVTRASASLVRRFAATRLPLLIMGEVGSGQDRVARAVFSLDPRGGTWVSISGAEVTAASLSDLSREMASLPLDLAVTIAVESLDSVPAPAFSPLANFIEQEQNRRVYCRLLATSRGDLLERVYRGEFPDFLYYRFATLKIALAPLRERQDDLADLAAWFARLYAERLGLGEVVLLPAAVARLRNYLWFGNAAEMETVIARTLAARRKREIDEGDLIFDFSEEPLVSEPADTLGRQIAPEGNEAIRTVSSAPAASGLRNGRSVELRVLIHELAHELKNPMVTIKTFAQLLGERYQDETFRARFQDVVDGDIERMDDLLEVMIEFADFSPPRLGRLLLEDRLRSTVEELGQEFSRKQVTVRWSGNGNKREILADAAHLKYIFKNALLAMLAQAKAGSDFDIRLERPGSAEIAYVREGARIMPITHYLAAAPGEAPLEVLPLRLLLAKQLLERNGARMTTEHLGDERDLIKMEFTLA
ncbi:MAG TPA: histidine kinase dimerization/phospho-acceptor domain-containing protein [Candidatus Eisenbacteria bacterium]|nr:histidine kinase dimerization/phospho-acceptor domain-containing protein [Candidatus Eisenbacteria bacterium]